MINTIGECQTLNENGLLLCVRLTIIRYIATIAFACGKLYIVPFDVDS